MIEKIASYVVLRRIAILVAVLTLATLIHATVALGAFRWPWESSTSHRHHHHRVYKPGDPVRCDKILEAVKALDPDRLDKALETLTPVQRQKVQDCVTKVPVP